MCFQVDPRCSPVILPRPFLVSWASPPRSFSAEVGPGGGDGVSYHPWFRWRKMTGISLLSGRLVFGDFFCEDFSRKFFVLGFLQVFMQKNALEQNPLTLFDAVAWNA